MKTRNLNSATRNISCADPLPPFPFPRRCRAGQGSRSDRCAGRIVLGRAHLHHRPGGKADGCSGKLIEAGREAGLTLINKGFSSNHGGVALIVQKDEKVANLVTVERTFEYEYRYSTTWWWSRKR